MGWIKIFCNRALYSLSLLAIFAIPPVTAHAQKDSGPLVLEHADRLISTGGNGEIVNLVGHVHFIHDKTDLYSERATWYKTAGLVQFVDSVLVDDGSRKITAQNVTYYRRDRRITAMHNVKMVDPKQDIILTCNKAEYFRDDRHLEATGNPRLVLNPYDDTSRMEINSLRMYYYADSAFGSAYDSVTIIRHDLNAHAGQADFYRNPEKAILTRNPIIINEENKLTGDTISVFTENKKLNRLLVDGHARAVYKTIPDTALEEYTTAEISGRQLEAFFANNRLETMVTRHNAVSEYHPAVTDTLVQGTNLASGDSITLFFNIGGIKRVYIQGGAQGQFIESKIDSESKVKFDTTHYSASEIDYRFADSEVRLYNHGQLTYQDMMLEAGDIKYNTETRILVAQGLGGDTSDAEIQDPVLKQGTEELVGKKMSYNIDSRRGQVRMARTEFQKGFYSGQTLRQTSKNVLLVSGGNYTSCDKPDDPHFHFHSNRMKMVNKDKVIARPVYLYMGDIPVFAIPYYVFPVKKGRHSGFLPFHIGNFQRGERFISNVGYYWALSQYWDIATSLDFYENSHTTYNGAVNYVVGRNLNGYVTGRYSRDSNWNRATYTQNRHSNWQMTFSHSQTISQTARLAGSGTFVSDKSFISNNVYDPAERLNRQITSNLTYSNSWRNRTISSTLRMSQNWNLDTDLRSEVLPSFTITRSSLSLFPDPTKTTKKKRYRPDEVIDEPQKRFYHNIMLSLGTSGQNVRNRSRLADSTFIRKDYQTLTTNSSLSSPFKVLGFLNLNPSFNFNHYGARLEPGRLPDSLGLAAGKFVTRQTYSLGISANTVVYGMVNPKIGGLTGLRHVVTPSVGYSFTPKITKNQSYFLYTGSGSNTVRSKTMTFGVTNLFQAKYLSREAEKKLDLFSLNFSSNYNFAALKNKQGNLSTNMRTSAIPHVDFSYNTTHSFYNYNSDIRRPLLKPRLTNMGITSSVNGGFHPSGGKKDDDEGGDKPDANRSKAFGSISRSGLESSSMGIDFTLSYTYSESKPADVKTKTQWIDLTTQITPTTNWRIAYGCHYNLQAKRIESQELNIGRDLHCWEAYFSWVPSGAVAGYYLKINIKSLPDIKVEESEGGLRGVRGF